MAKREKDSSESCQHHLECEAPMCPLDERSLKRGIWWPYEEICRAEQLQSMDWIKKLKEIAEKYGDEERYFTMRMLDVIESVPKGIIGADPDGNYKIAVDEWIKDWTARNNKLKKLWGDG